MENIILISCPQHLTRDRLPFGYSQEPLHLLYLGKVIKDIANPVILDYNVERYDPGELIDHLNNYKPKIIGFTFTAASYLTFQQILSDISSVKKKNGFITVAGGIQASSMPDYTFRNNPDLDFIIIGEGEIPFRDFVNSKSSQYEKVKNLFSRNNDTAYKGDEYNVIDVEELGWPDRTMISQNKYRDYKTLRSIGSIFSSRGCPYACSFCYNSLSENRSLRYRSAESLIEEVIEARDKFGIHCFFIMDDFFTFNIDRVKSFCNGILSKKIKIRWYCQGRADQGDYEMFKLMRDSGCRSIAMGIESGSEKNLKYIGKKTNKEKMLKTIGLAQKAGIKLRGNFIIGFPGENHEEIMSNIAFAKSLKLSRTAFFILTPFPHSLIWNEAVERKLIDVDTIDWNRFNQQSPFFVDKVGPRELIRYLNWGNQHTTNNILQKIYNYIVSADKREFIIDYFSYYLRRFHNQR